MCDSQGQSKGSGFVAFTTPEEATRAVSFFSDFAVFQMVMHRFACVALEAF